MRERSKIVYLLLIVALVVNLVLPTSMVIANNQPVNSTSNTVTGDVYGSSAKISALSVTQSVYEIPVNIITDVVMTNDKGENISVVRPDQGSKVQIDFKWELPANHPYLEGSTFTFELPKHFILDSEKTGDLDNYGTFIVTPEGKVTFTFSKDIEGTAVTGGTFNVWRSFDEKSFVDGTHQDIEFLYQGDRDIVPIHFLSKSTSEIDKKGTANKGKNASEISWEVDFNKGEKSITNAIFKDELPTGLTVDMNSIEVVELIVKLDGTVEEKTTPFIGNAPVSNVNGFQLDFGNINSAYRVKYKTTITGTSDKTYNNKVTVSGDNLPKPQEVSKGVTVTYSKPLNKTSTGYNSSTQTITWVIEYNYNEQKIAHGNAWIKDTFDKTTQALVPGSFKVTEMKIEDNGNATSKGVVTNYDIDETLADGFQLAFKDKIESAYRIEYKTTSIDRVYDDSVAVKNTVEMSGVTPVDKTVNMNQVIFKKNNGTVNFNKKTIDWTINLNNDNQLMDDVVINDSFIASQGLTFLPDSLKIGSLKEGTDYTVAPNPSYNDGFIITFIKPINSSQLISYTTKFDSTKKVTQYKNTAALDWTEKGIKQTTITKNGTADPDTYTKDNGNKTGTYNAETKEITWTIDVNYNLHTITNALVRDFYTGKQTFVKGSLTVTPLTLTGGNNGVSAGSPVTVPDADVDYTVKDNGNDGFELKLGLINSAYRITYRTSLEGHRVEATYNNKATMYDENTPNDLLFDKSATVKPSHGGEYVNKTGKQGTGADSDFAYWTVNINNSQSQVEAGAKLTDTLSANQILVQDSFKLYETDQYGKLTKAGIVSDANYTLDVVGNTFTLTFKNELKRAYILEYKSFINADQNETVSNDAKFEGQSAGAVDKNENKAFKVYFSGAGGGATTPKGNLTIVKVDAADHNVKLDGATFGLYDKTGNTLIKTGVTDTDGKVVFDNIKYKEYMLKELLAPTGYLFDVDYKAGKVITFNATNSTIQVENTKGVWDFELTKVDAIDPTKALEGAHFKLQMKNNSGTYEDVTNYSDMITLFDGKISYKALVKGGNYQLIETAAPSGYKLDVTPIHFTIDQNQTSTKKVTMKNTKNVGSVELLKMDIHDGKVLEGVEFDLQDENGKVLQTGLKTDQDGKLSVGKLNAGHYQFVEVTPLPDYELNATPLPFDIVNDGVTVNVEFKNKLTPGSVKLTKTETGLPVTGLQGAQFSILDENKVLVVDKDVKGLKDLTTDVNGELRIPDLRPGKYYFEETVAPSGYIIKTTLTEFEIIKNQETIVIVENDRLISGGGGTTPGIPVDPTPSTPVDPTPSTPVDPTPSTPVGPTPSTPVGPTPSTPVGPTPSTPVGPTPSTPVDPTPSTPVEPTPSTPVIPKENVTTPIETPIKGKVEVPNESIPNISGEPKNGTVTVDPKGNWVYTPDKGFIGKDSFEIIITDEDGHEQEVQIDVDVKAMPKDETDGAKNAGTTTQGQTVATLPQTGERSHLPLQLTGISFIILGAILLLFRKKRLQ